MNAPYWKLRAKVQDATSAVLKQTDDPGVPVLVGFTDFQPVVDPCVTIVAASMKPYIPEVVSQDCGTREVLLTVSIRSQADYTTDESGATLSAYEYHAKLVARVMDVMNDIEIVYKLNAAGVPDLTVMQFDLQEERQEVNDNSIITEQDINVVCNPS